MQMSDVGAQKMWFAKYVTNGCNWAEVEAEERAFQRITQEDDETHAWLVKSQLEDLYKSEAIGSAVFENAMKDPAKWRHHPEVPWLKEAMRLVISETQNAIRSSFFAVRCTFAETRCLPGASH